MPAHNLEHKDKAAICLKIVVIGGSVAGLAAAYALRQAGHDVHVVEKSDGKSKSFGGHQCTPNMTKILYRWGLQPLLDRVAVKCSSMVFRKGVSGDLIGAINLDKDFLVDLLADWLFIQDQELKDMLLQLASDEGVNLSFSTTVTGVRTTPDDAIVTLDNGQTIMADFLVVADGYDSELRSLVTGVDDEDDRIPEQLHLAVAFTIPVELVCQDEELRPLTNPANWSLWIGPGFVLHGFINGGKDLSMTLTCDYDRELQAGDEVWTDHPLEYYGLDLNRFEPRVQKLLRLVKVTSGRIFVTRKGPEDLVCENSKIVLVGDAAHPLIPAGNHHTALTFEDAETLRCLFSRIRSPGQISHFLTAYEEIRQPRAGWGLQYDLGFHSWLRLPNGPAQDDRNANLTLSMANGSWDCMDESLFRAVWGNELDMYAHDATEKVDDWWQQWGSMIAVKKDTKRHQPSPSPEASSNLIPGLHRVSFHHP
ncbi:hypothetical protein GALMADRAFT_259251 [Galerina marginata CBS 339.88]|uniref:FAD-binding domain-containing protein n=1 Tax=Galerina marginata (strain CBS 339.88) TaxID=685588 RepID=A0A067SIA2_GALM3|nr:hypothetical protein GALMADRAFT_259251 [Galerina marginata CBS 339.88]